MSPEFLPPEYDDRQDEPDYTTPRWRAVCSQCGAGHMVTSIAEASDQGWRATNIGPICGDCCRKRGIPPLRPPERSPARPAHPVEVFEATLYRDDAPIAGVGAPDPGDLARAYTEARIEYRRTHLIKGLEALQAFKASIVFIVERGNYRIECNNNGGYSIYEVIPYGPFGTYTDLALAHTGDIDSTVTFLEGLLQ